MPSHPVADQEELLDLVNEQDEVIGVLPRSEVYARGLSNFRASNGFIRNSRGQLWIPRRVATKKLFPLGLDMSIAGHVGSGETYDESFAREAFEEIGVDVTKLPVRVLGFMTPHEHGTAAFVKAYEIQLDEAPTLNPHDYIEAYWLTPKEVLDRLAQGETSKEDLPRMIRHFYPEATA
jgi:isopentenyl-diphosphate delta-isomerase